MAGRVGWQLGVVLSSLLPGCSVYPLPENLPGVDTTQVVENVRCNMGVAVRGAAIDYIRNLGDVIVYPGRTGRQIADEIEFGHANYGDFRPDLLDIRIRKAFAYYDQAKVGFDFDLDTKEENTQSVGGTATRTFLRRVDTFGFLGQNDLTRQVQRNFRVQDEFKFLGSDTFARYCVDVLKYKIYNIEFPVTGRLPFSSLVKSFVYANEQQNLQGDEKLPAIPKMADTFMFTTKITANVDPASAFNPVGRGLFPSTLAFKIDNARTDYHKVIVAIAVPPRTPTVARGGELSRLFLTREEFVSRTLDEQRERNTQNAIVKIGDAVSRFPF